MKNYKQTHNDEDRPKSVESNVNVSIIEIGESSQSQLLLGSLGLKSTKIWILVILNNTSFLLFIHCLDFTSDLVPNVKV